MIERKERQGSNPEERKGREVIQRKERQGSDQEERKAGK